MLKISRLAAIHDELARLVREAQLAPAVALKRAIGGSIEPGSNADMIVLDADPLFDIRHTQKIDAVVFGETLTRAHLNGFLSHAAQPGLDRR